LEKRFKLFLEVLGMEVMMEDVLSNQVSKLQKIWSPIGYRFGKKHRHRCYQTPPKSKDMGDSPGFGGDFLGQIYNP